MIKHTVQTLALLGFLLYSVGCASLENNAYRSIGATAVIVDASMNGWGDYVRAGKATPEDELAVRQTYEGYQKAMSTAKVAIATYQVSKNKSALNLALDILDATKNDLVDAIMKGRQ